MFYIFIGNQIDKNNLNLRLSNREMFQDTGILLLIFL